MQKKCSTKGCFNQVVQGGKCISHGAKIKKRTLCSTQGCSHQAVQGGKCISHGPIKKTYVKVQNAHALVIHKVYVGHVRQKMIMNSSVTWNK